MGPQSAVGQLRLPDANSWPRDDCRGWQILQWMHRGGGTGDVQVGKNDS